jgi:hypothetical protein
VENEYGERREGDKVKKGIREGYREGDKKNESKGIKGKGTKYIIFPEKLKLLMH